MLFHGWIFLIMDDGTLITKLEAAIFRLARKLQRLHYFQLGIPSLPSLLRTCGPILQVSTTRQSKNEL